MAKSYKTGYHPTKNGPEKLFNILKDYNRFGMATLGGKLLAFGGDTDFFSDYQDPDTGPLENLTDTIEEWDSVEEK